MSTAHTHIPELIIRLARLNAAETWVDDLNPAQMSALGYLSLANQFSRAPSLVAEYLGTTRGTMSQTLKALERKGYVSEIRSEIDKRSISYDLTPEGAKTAAKFGALDKAIAALPVGARARIEDGLSAALLTLVETNGGREFGVCKTCQHHQQKNGAPYCGLLKVALEPQEAEQICQEHKR
jgi:DNA-binding MarR family transcriptional regulator